MSLLCDFTKVRCKELRTTLASMTNRSTTHLRKRELITTLRKCQIARRFVRRTRLIMYRRATVLQRWWRRVRRYIPVNECDPITLEQWRHVYTETWFHLVASSNSVLRYDANQLYLYLHSQLAAVEPLTRCLLNEIELARLDRLVSSENLARHGESVHLLSPEVKQMRICRTQQRDVDTVMEDEIHTCCANIRRLIWHINSTTITDVASVSNVLVVLTKYITTLQCSLLQFVTISREACSSLVSHLLKEMKTLLCSCADQASAHSCEFIASFLTDFQQRWIWTQSGDQQANSPSFSPIALCVEVYPVQ